MIRPFVAIVALVAGAAVAAAQQSPIKQRQALMKKNADADKIGAAMVKGESPFDLAKAKMILATIASDAHKLKDLWPAGSDKGDDTRALPKIWLNLADFEAHRAKLEKDAKAAEASVTDFASFKTQFAIVGKDCGACHKLYRRPKQS